MENRIKTTLTQNVGHRTWLWQLQKGCASLLSLNEEFLGTSNQLARFLASAPRWAGSQATGSSNSMNSDLLKKEEANSIPFLDLFLENCLKVSWKVQQVYPLCPYKGVEARLPGVPGLQFEKSWYIHFKYRTMHQLHNPLHSCIERNHKVWADKFPAFSACNMSQASILSHCRQGGETC